jgi:lipopolysaccharide exporter
MSRNAVSMSVLLGLGMIRSVIVARLLAPDDYGLFGMAMSALATMSSLTDMGLAVYIIARDFESPDEIDVYLNTVWTADLGRRLLLTLLLLAATYPTALFYGDERLCALLPVVALAPLIQGFQNIGLVLYRKRVEFSRIIWYEQTCGFISFLMAILVAVVFRNVWALVAALLGGAFVSTVLSYVFHPYRPRLAFDHRAFRNSFNFGKHMFVVGGMTLVTTTADNIALGRMVGVEVLGIYVLAYGIASLPVGIIGNVASTVMIPAYAELKTEDQSRLGTAVARAFAVCSSLLFVIMLPIFVFSKELILVLYGSQWEKAIPILQVLILLGLARGLVHTLSPLMIGANRPDLDAKAKTFEAFLLLVLLYPLIRQWGAMGAAWAGVIVYFVTFLIRIWFARQLAPGSTDRIPKVMLVMSLAFACGGLAGFLISRYVMGDVWRLVLGSVASMGVASAIILLMCPDIRTEVGNLTRSVRRSLGVLPRSS